MIRQAIREAMERGEDPVGDHFDQVARDIGLVLAVVVILAVFGALAMMVGP